MRILDLFCGAGGAGMGYYRAGFRVYGIDKNPQPHYPFPFLQMDAMEALTRLLNGEGLTFSNGETLYLSDFSAIHASPPCQGYSITKSLPGVGEYPKLIEPVRLALIATGKIYSIENVPGAPLLNPIELCGTMFGLKIIRHRLFETSPVIWFLPATCKCKNLYTGSHCGYSSFAKGAQAITVAGNNYDPKDGAVAMGIDWMIRDELSEAIPPAYTEFIGKQLLGVLQP